MIDVKLPRLTNILLIAVILPGLLTLGHLLAVFNSAGFAPDSTLLQHIQAAPLAATAAELATTVSAVKALTHRGVTHMRAVLTDTAT